MNLVKTYIDKSEIEGIGLFAAEFIPKGTIVWDLHPPFDVVLDEKFIEAIKDSLPQTIKDHIFRYGFFQDGKFVLCADDARFSNHSSKANTITVGKKQIALVDINVGEEITSNYSEFDDVFTEDEFKILKSYRPIR